MGLFSFLRTSEFEEGIARAKEENGILLDVRTEEEFSEGHIRGAINIPLDRLAETELAKNKKLFVYCHSGARSGRAVAYLQSQGYQAENIGGIGGYRGEKIR